MASNNLPNGNSKTKEDEQGKVKKEKLISKDEDSLTETPSTSYPTFEEPVCLCFMD